MTDFTSAFHAAFTMVVTLDSGLMEIVGLSLRVNFVAVGVAVGVGFPVGAGEAAKRSIACVVLVGFANEIYK